MLPHNLLDRTYGQLVATVTETHQPLVAVERALYRLSQQVDPAPDRTWRKYGTALADHLAAI